MATIDTSLFPSAAVKFQMAEAPTGIDFAALQQQKLANQVTAQNLATAKYNAQKQKLFDAMADVVQHETPADTNAAIDRYVADGTLTAAQAADAKSKVPPMDENGNFDKDAFNKYKLSELQHYSSNVESVIKGLQENQRQQQISRILGLDAAPAPAAPTNALAPTPTVAAPTSQPAAPAAAPTNALVSPTAQGVDVNALRNRINALYMMGEDKLAASLEDQLPKTPTETDLAKLIREQKDYKPNSPEWKAYQRKIDEASGGLTAYQTAYLAHLAEQEKRLSTTATGGGKTTVSQEQAGYNVNRLLNAADQITTAMTAEEGVQKPGLKETVVKGTFPSLAGGVQSAQRQIVDAAQTDMLDALLYLATGAAYNKEQLEGQKKSYLPSFLDKPETVAAKQQRLITLIQNAKTRAGNAWTPDMDKKMDSILSSFKAAGTTQTKVSGKGTKDDPIKLD